MAERFARLFGALHARRRGVAAALVLLLLGCAAGLVRIPLDHSIEVMLPSGSGTQETVRFLREADFSAKVVLSFSQVPGQEDRAGLFAALDRFVGSLDSPLILEVLGTVDNRQVMEDIGFFLERVPELYGPADLAALEQRLTPEGVGRALRRKYVQLIKPEGAFVASLVRSDPLDLRMELVERLRSMSDSFGYEIRIEDGRIVSADGLHAMVVLETAVPFTDSKGARDLVGYLDARLGQLPPAIVPAMVCGHLHTLSNERVVKRDIALTVGVAGTAFVLLFLLFFKDLRANLVFLLPFAALLVAVNLCSLLPGTLSSIMLGFGTVVAGIAVDYGIHVYIAVRRGRSAADAVQAVARPLLLGALTTAGVFFAFLFSTIPGYRQLAGFALLSVALSAGLALFVLPLYIVPGSLRARDLPSGRMARKRASATVALFAAALLAAVPAARRAGFDGSIERLDGTEERYLAAERDFQAAWGSGEAGQAIYAVAGADLETALELNDRVYDLAIERLGAENVSSLSRIWKSAKVREANRRRWNAFWDEGRKAALRRLLREEGAPFGFAQDAFEPFFAGLEAPAPAGDAGQNRILAQLEGRFVQRRDGRVQVMGFFPDRPEWVEAMLAVQEAVPGMVLVSRNAVSRTLARDYTGEFVRVSLVALALVLAAAALLLGRLRLTLVVLAPALAGVAGVVLLSGLLGRPLNVMNLLSGIIVVGLCIDYGIFYVHAYTRSLRLGTRTAISLSAGTTLIGTGALLFARHPALFAVGLTLSAGIGAGYAAAMLVVPALCRLLLLEEERP